MTTEDFPHVVPWSAWSEQQLSFVRYLTSRLARAETRIEAVKALITQSENRIRGSVPPTAAESMIAEGVAVSVRTGDLRRALEEA